MLIECVQACKTWNLNLKTLGFKLQLVNNLFWVSRDILMGGDEFALANESPPIGIYKVNCSIRNLTCIKASESHMTNYYSPTSWSVQMLVSSRAGIDDTVRRDECI